MIKTLKMKCPRYLCNSSIQNGDLTAHLDSCMHLNRVDQDDLGEYLKDFLDPRSLYTALNYVSKVAL